MGDSKLLVDWFNNKVEIHLVRWNFDHVSKQDAEQH